MVFLDGRKYTLTINFRPAVVSEVPVILQLIKELADYEGLLSEVVATEELLTEWLFEKNKAEVIFGLVEGEIVGFSLFFHNFSTFLGRAGIYLEDLYVRPDFRGFGFGTAFISELARIAKARGCGRLEWWCLNENHPSMAFYRSLGAEPMEDWTVFRLAGATLDKLAQKKIN